MNVCVFVFMYVGLCMHIFINYVYMFMHICIYFFACVFVWVCVYVYVICMWVCVFMCVQGSHTYMKELQRHLLEDEEWRGTNVALWTHIGRSGGRINMHSIALIKVGHTKNSYRSGFLPDTPRQIRTYLLEFIWKIINPTKKKHSMSSCFIWPKNPFLKL